MSKYEELLWKAVARIPRDRPDLRRDMYDRARAALRRQLQKSQPPISEINIAAEERALNEAIERIEMNPTDETATLSPPTAGAQNRSGRLSELLKRASLDVALARFPKKLPQPLGSPMDFAPRRAKSEPTDSARNADFLVATPGLAEEPLETKPPPDGALLNSILRRLQEESPGVEATAFIYPDGSMASSALAFDMEGARIAGMASTLQNIGARASQALARGETREVIIRGKAGYAILIRAENGMLLLALADDSSKLGLIFLNMQEAIKTLTVAMDQSAAPK